MPNKSPEHFRPFKPPVVTRFVDIVGEEEARRVGEALMKWHDTDIETEPPIDTGQINLLPTRE